MRLVLRVLLGVALLVLVVLAAAGLLLPRLVGGDAARAQLDALAREYTGQPLRYATLEFGWLPPRVVVTSPRLGAEPEAPLVAADAISFRVSVLPLFAGKVEIAALDVEGPELTVVREESGLVLPWEAAPPAPPPEPSAQSSELRDGAEGDASDEAAAENDDDGGILNVRRVGVRAGRVRFVDRTIAPAFELELRAVEADAAVQLLRQSGTGRASAELSTGGRLTVEGERALDRSGHADLTLEGIGIDAFRAYLEDVESLAGRADGTIAITRAAGAPVHAVLDLAVAEGVYHAGGTRLEGPLALGAELDLDEGDLRGPFSVDATAATLESEGTFAKAPGTDARLAGQLEWGGDGTLRVRDGKLRLYNTEASLAGTVLPEPLFVVSAPAVDLEGWEALLPALEGSGVSGKVAFDALEIVPEPLSVRGRIGLSPLHVAGFSDEPLTLDGALVGEGKRLRSDGLRAGFAGLDLPVDLVVKKLAADVQRYTLKTGFVGADSAALVARLTGRKHLLSGPLDFDADLRGDVDGDTALESLTGTVKFAIAPGRLENVHFLRLTFDTVQAVRGKLDEKGSPYDVDEFERFSGTLKLDGGVARTDDFALQYPTYRLDLRGTITLTDLELDMVGKLTIDPELDQELADGRGGRRRVIPLAHVGGTLDDPQVQVTNTALAAYAAGYATEERREEWEKEIDERLGDGSGRQVLDALQGVLDSIGEPKQP